MLSFVGVIRHNADAYDRPLYRKSNKITDWKKQYFAIIHLLHVLLALFTALALWSQALNAI